MEKSSQFIQNNRVYSATLENTFADTIRQTNLLLYVFECRLCELYVSFQNRIFLALIMKNVLSHLFNMSSSVTSMAANTPSTKNDNLRVS